MSTFIYDFTRLQNDFDVVSLLSVKGFLVPGFKDIRAVCHADKFMQKQINCKVLRN